MHKWGDQNKKKIELSIKNDFTFSCFIATKSVQEIIPNKKSKINKNITKNNSSVYKEIDESQEAETLLNKTASKQLMKIDNETLNKKKEQNETIKDSDRRPNVIIFSFIKGNTANKIVEVQDKLVKHGVDESFGVKKAKIHIYIYKAACL